MINGDVYLEGKTEENKTKISLGFVQEVYKLIVILADFGEEAQTDTYSIL